MTLNDLYDGVTPEKKNKPAPQTVLPSNVIVSAPNPPEQDAPHPKRRNPDVVLDIETQYALESREPFIILAGFTVVQKEVEDLAHRLLGEEADITVRPTEMGNALFIGARVGKDFDILINNLTEISNQIEPDVIFYPNPDSDGTDALFLSHVDYLGPAEVIKFQPESGATFDDLKAALHDQLSSVQTELNGLSIDLQEDPDSGTFTLTLLGGLGDSTEQLDKVISLLSTSMRNISFEHAGSAPALAVPEEQLVLHGGQDREQEAEL